MKNKDWCCVIRLGSIGDSIIATSVLPLLAQDYNVEVVCEKPHDVVYENNPFISKLTVLEKGHVADLADWVRKRKEEGYKKTIHLSHTCEAGLAFFKAQFEFDASPSFRRWRAGHSYLEYVHRSAEVPFTFDPRFYPTDEEQQKALETKARVGARVIGFVVSGSRIDKVWPYSTLAVARIIRELGLPVILFGGPGGDYEIAKEIQRHVKEANGTADGCVIAISQPPAQEWKPNHETGYTEVVEPAPLWPIRRTLTQVGVCDLVIGPDTGLMWGCSMLEMPKIMLLSHASDENITKHWRNTVTLHADPARVPCWPCHKLHDDKATCLQESRRKAEDQFSAACISDISVDAVLRAAHEALHPPRRSVPPPQDDEDAVIVSYPDLKDWTMPKELAV